MVSFIIVGQPVMTRLPITRLPITRLPITRLPITRLPIAPCYDSTANAVNQGLIVILRQ
jgi:hypothetical protein